MSSIESSVAKSSERSESKPSEDSTEDMGDRLNEAPRPKIVSRINGKLRAAQCMNDTVLVYRPIIVPCDEVVVGDVVNSGESFHEVLEIRSA